MTIRVTYPGRIGLLGEHCDWAGGASLVVPLQMSVTVEAVDRPSGISCRSVLDGRIVDGTWPIQGTVNPNGGELRFVAAVASALHARGIDVPPTHVEVTGDLPPGRGFSSSAALTLAITDALVRRATHDWASVDLAEFAYHVERELLQVECGRLDQLACAARRPLFLRWIDGAAAETRTITPASTLQLVVAAFSQPRDTQAILAALNRHVADTNNELGDPDTSEGVRRTVASWARLATTAVAALERGDFHALGQAMNEAQASYSSALADRLPELKAPRLQEICGMLTGSLAALGAKFSGAGGDGSVVAIFANAPDARQATDVLNREADLSAWLSPVS